MFVVDYYEDMRGRKPVEEFIDGLDVKMRAKRIRNDWRTRHE